MKYIRFQIILMLTIVIPCFLNAQTTYTWLGGGSWEVADNWSPSGIPGPDDIVAISSGTAPTTGSRIVAGLQFSGGTLQLNDDGQTTGSLTVTGSASWSGGTIADLTAAGSGTLTIADSAILSIEGVFNTKSLSATIRNEGTASFVGSSALNASNSAVFDNQGLFEFISDGDFNGSSNASGTFLNSGTVLKHTGTNVSNFSGFWDFQNLGGTIDVQSGTIWFSGPSTFDGGTYSVADGATIDFKNSHTFKGTLSGEPLGDIIFSTGTIEIDPAGATLDIGGSGFRWSGGTVTGEGTLTIPAEGLFLLDGVFNTKSLSVSTLLNLGTIGFVGNAALNAADTTVIDNQALFEFISDGDFNGSSNASGTFLNSGTVLKHTGTNVSNFSSFWDFQNLGGTVDVQSGTIWFSGPSTFDGGTYSVADGATIDFKDSHTFKGTLSGEPLGDIIFSTGTIEIDPAGATLDIGGSGFRWSGGTVTGEGTLTIPAEGLFLLDGVFNTKSLSVSTLLNLGTIGFVGNAALNAADTTVIDNQALFEFVSDGDFNGSSNASGTFLNSGTVLKHTGTNVSNFSSFWDFQNQAGGIIEVASGELQFANLNNAEGASIRGIATIDVPNDFANDGIVAPGLVAGVGLLTHIGDYNPSATAVFEIDLGGLIGGSEYDQLAITGDAMLNGTLDVELVDGFMPEVGDSFVVMTTTGAVSDNFLLVNEPAGLSLRILVNDEDVTLVVDSVGTVGIEDQIDNSPVEIPTRITLHNNYPNPFNPTTHIRYDIPARMDVRLVVYDMLGKKVVTLVEGQQPAGYHEVQWDGRDAQGQQISSGVYIYRMETARQVHVRRMLLVR